jgi:uncharacterized membrane protein YdbT with pleckstrin-like domain
MMPGEHPIRITRQHWTVFIGVGLACIAALAAGIVLLVVTPGSVSGHSLHDIKVFIGLGLFVVVVAIGLVRWVQWRATSYTLTTHRIISRRGVLSRYTESIALDRVQDSSVHQRLLGRLFQFGDVELESAGRDGAEVLHHVADPAGFSNDLLLAIEARHAGLPHPGAPGGSGEVQAAQGAYVPPSTQGGEPGGYGPAPGYSGRRDGV